MVYESRHLLRIAASALIVLRRHHISLLCVSSLLILSPSASAQSLQGWIDANCESCATLMSDKTGVFVLEMGEEALMGRAWLAQHATKTIDIQYFIWSTDNIGILAAEMLLQAADRGVRIRISTNSLASTDNLPAFGGYFKQRPRLINAGIELYEYKPHPQIQTELIQRYPQLADKNPIFAIHAKTMVIDGTRVFVGTFNLDPRSANLNTEVGALLDNPILGHQLTHSIERDIRPENSWKTTSGFSPDREASRSKRLGLGFINLFPLDPVL